jgi:hypothetical protein
VKTLFFEYIGPQYMSAQCECAGLSLRIGHRAWVLGTLDYREQNPTWPRWLRFRLCLHGPRNPSMSNRPLYALYLFGCRIFDNAYWPAKGHS